MSGSKQFPADPRTVRYTAAAAEQVADLRTHYEGRFRLEAARNLETALADAEAVIAYNPEAGLPAPRPYPDLARDGEAWILCGRYWVAFRPLDAVIIGVFYDTSDIPRRRP